MKELFARHSGSVQQHVDDVISELGNLGTLDEKAKAVYLFSADAEVAKLEDVHEDAAADILEWKLELARLTGDEFAAAKAMLGLAQCASRSGNVEASQEWLDKVTAIANSFEESSASISLVIESDYEGARNLRHTGNLDAANRILYRTISECKTLTEQSQLPDDDIAPEQRAIWWSLRSKYLLAEICREQGQVPTAIQLYAEYSLECIARMIGLIGGPAPGQGLLWYFLFSPNALVQAIWSCTRALFEIRAFSPAADMAAVVMHAATLFGNKVVNDAAAELRAHAKISMREYKKQQAALRASTGSPSSSLFDFGGRPVQSPHEYLRNSGLPLIEDDFEGSVESEEDWDKMLAEELNIKIERCSNAAGLADGGLGSAEHATNLPSQASHVDDSSFISSAGNTGYANSTPKPTIPTNTNYFAAYQRSASTDLMEGELRQYLNRIHGAAATYRHIRCIRNPLSHLKGQSWA